MKSEKYNIVKNELKELRLLDRMIDTLLKTENKYKLNKQLLSECVNGESSVETALIKAVSLREKYYPLIFRLEPLDRIIILDGYIGKKPYWKIGNEIGYSKDGIQKRTYIIIKKLADML